MHSVSDLTTSSRKTSGTVPPKLVGASTTIVGDKLYLFGGRLVAERRMVADLYVFDLDTFVWTCVPPYPGDDVPGARYFHSADSCEFLNPLLVSSVLLFLGDAGVDGGICRLYLNVRPYRACRLIHSPRRSSTIQSLL